MGQPGIDLFQSMLDQLQSGLHALPDKPEETPISAARALWHLAGGSRLSAQAAQERSLAPLGFEQQDALWSLVRQRLDGVPLAHLTGRQRFMGVELLAGAGALIPRAETELLGWHSALLLQQFAESRPRPLAVDLCTGCGNLAIGLAHAVPSARLLCADLSAEAVELARKNVAHAGLGLRVEVRQGDLLEPFDEPGLLGAIDMLVCNPPYISSSKVSHMPTEISGFEPSLAFDGGPFGVRILNRLIQDAPRFLRPGGWLAFEVGAGQGRAVLGRLAASKQFEEALTIQDAQGETRAVAAQRRS